MKMRKRYLTIGCCLLLCACTPEALQALGNKQLSVGIEDKTHDSPASIQITGVPVNAKVGQTVSLKATIDGNVSQDVLWELESQELARIENNNTLVFLQPGLLKISVKAQANPGLSQTAFIQVAENIPVPTASVQPTPSPEPSPTPQVSSSPPTVQQKADFELTLLSTQFPITGDPVPPVYYYGSVTNHGSQDIPRAVMQAYIEQGELQIAAGGAIIPLGVPSETDGLLLANHTTYIDHPTLGTAKGYRYSANAGFAVAKGMVQGPAILVLQLIDQSLKPQVILYEKRFEITLVL